jgi:hypothetical protein
MDCAHFISHVHSPLVVINDFYIASIGIFPLEAHPPLLVDADAVLPRTVTAQCLKAVAWQSHQIVDGLGVVQDFEPSFCLRGAGFELPDALSLVERFSILAAERFNHGQKIEYCMLYVKRKILLVGIFVLEQSGLMPCCKKTTLPT